MRALTSKIATEDFEFEQIHRLNYKTFVEEIPQHTPNPDGRLVDKFHHENAYVICLQDDKLQGMVAVRDKRPFSLDGKLSNLDTYLPSYRSICEFRLLAIEKACRYPAVFQSLMARLGQYCEERGYDLGVMSGTVRQSGLYQQLGFVPFGPLVGAPTVPFQPMYITRDAYGAMKERFQAIFHEVGDQPHSIY